MISRWFEFELQAATVRPKAARRSDGLILDAFEKKSTFCSLRTSPTKKAVSPDTFRWSSWTPFVFLNDEYAGTPMRKVDGGKRTAGKRTAGKHDEELLTFFDSVKFLLEGEAEPEYYPPFGAPIYFCA